MATWMGRMVGFINLDGNELRGEVTWVDGKNYFATVLVTDGPAYKWTMPLSVLRIIRDDDQAEYARAEAARLELSQERFMRLAAEAEVTRLRDELAEQSALYMALLERTSDW